MGKARAEVFGVQVVWWVWFVAGGEAIRSPERYLALGGLRASMGVNAETPPLRGGVSGSAREPDDYLLSHG